MCTGLHQLVRGQVTDVTGTDGQHVLAQQGELGIHHLLNNGCRIDARHIVVLESRHEGNGTCGYHQGLCFHIKILLIEGVFDGNPLVLQDVPYG